MNPKNGNSDIAICLSGQMRQFAICLPEFFQHLVDPLGADLFVHTWDHVGGTAPVKSHLSLIQRFREGRMYNLVSASGCYSQPQNYPITPGMVQAIYDPVLFEVENQQEVALRQGFSGLIPDWLQAADAATDGMADMLYTQYRVHQLRNAHERARGRPYRVVINTLPDLLWCGPLAVEVLTGSPTFWSSTATIASTHQVSCKLSVGCSRGMDVYASAFMRMHEFFDPAILSRPRAEWPVSERLLFQLLPKYGVPVSYFNAPVIRIRERLIPLEDGAWEEHVRRI